MALAIATWCATLAIPSPAQAQSATVVIHGRGFGHGRGMSQWGALGYALAGWSAEQILDHYYGGTTFGGREDRPLRVLLQNAASRDDVILYHDRGELRTSADGDVASRRALRLTRVADGRWQIWDGDSCGGPWTPWPGETLTTGISVWPAAPSDDPRSLVQVCDASGGRYYRGHLEMFATGGKLNVLNVVSRENYLRGVLPGEVPHTWWYLGAERGAQAVLAQAVAARSYVEAGDTRFTAEGADTCDTTLCQVYRGRAHRVGSTITSVEQPSTDGAVYYTRNTVRVHANGRVARTEFHSSSGGHTAGGVFPAVPDEGDSYAGNPVHRWTAEIPVADIEARWPGLGSFAGIDILARNGLGDDGGRVTSMRIRFANGSVDVTGDQFRSAFGLRSTWFCPTTSTEYVSYIDGAYRVLLGRPADASGSAHWAGQLCSGMPRGEFALALARTPEWVNTVIAGQYQQILGRSPDGPGLAYWSQHVRGGMRIAALASNLYASAEFYAAAGNTDAGWVNAMYQNILGRAPDPTGHAYWMGQLAAGVPRQTLANALFLSYESNIKRVDALYAQILGRAPDPGGRDYWGKQLATLDDINLAALLVASDEFYARHR